MRALVIVGAQGSADAMVIANSLQYGTIDAKFAALQALSGQTSLIVDPGAHAALKSELARITRARRQAEAVRISGAQPVAAFPQSGEPQYVLRLSDFVEQRKDPDFIPELTWFAAGSASDALADFGELAFEAVKARYSDRCFVTGDCPPLLRAGLLDAIAGMLQKQTLTNSLTPALELVREAILSDDWETLDGAIGVAAASCDPTLLGAVSNIVNGPRQLTVMSAGRQNGLIRDGARALQKCQH